LNATIDGRQDYGKDRFLTIGLVGDKELAVTYTLRDEVIRITSARETNTCRLTWSNILPP